MTTISVKQGGVPPRPSEDPEEDDYSEFDGLIRQASNSSAADIDTPEFDGLIRQASNSSAADIDNDGSRDAPPKIIIAGDEISGLDKHAVKRPIDESLRDKRSGSSSSSRSRGSFLEYNFPFIWSSNDDDNTTGLSLSADDSAPLPWTVHLKNSLFTLLQIYLFIFVLFAVFIPLTFLQSYIRSVEVVTIYDSLFDMILIIPPVLSLPFITFRLLVGHKISAKLLWNFFVSIVVWPVLSMILYLSGGYRTKNLVGYFGATFYELLIIVDSLIVSYYLYEKLKDKYEAKYLPKNFVTMSVFLSLPCVYAGLLNYVWPEYIFNSWTTMREKAHGAQEVFTILVPFFLFSFTTYISRFAFGLPLVLSASLAAVITDY
jgi:hypothetical protein